MTRDERTLPATIRAATVADVGPIVDLTWAVASEGRWIGVEVPFDRQERRDRLGGWLDAADAVVVVADAGGGEVVGSLWMTVARYGVADVAMLLAAGWRGRGLGGALLDVGLGWAGEAGAHKASLEVWPDNEAALALYRSRGFTEEGRRVRHYRRASGELWDSVLMGRPLPV